jgi:hypothetical protein
MDRMRLLNGEKIRDKSYTASLKPSSSFLKAADNQEFLENSDFLFNPQEEAFDLEEYGEMKSIIKDDV